MQWPTAPQQPVAFSVSQMDFRQKDPAMTDIILARSATVRSFKLPPRAMPVVFAFFMSAIMSFLMSCVIVAANNGISPDYLARVLSAYRVSMPTAFSCVLMVRPLALKLASLLVRLPG